MGHYTHFRSSFRVLSISWVRQFSGRCGTALLIVSAIGFTATPANLLTVPVYVLACIFTCGVGFLADRLGRRGYFTMYFE